VSLAAAVGSRWHRAAPALFAGQMVVLDLALRGASPYVHSPVRVSVCMNAVVSVLLGLLVFSLRERRAARVAIAASTGALVAVECLFFRYYHGTIDRQVVASALHTWSDIAPVLWHMLPATLLLAIPIGGAEYVLLSSGGKPLRRRRALMAGALLLALVLALPLRLGTPELRLLDAVTLAWAPRSAAAATTVEVPPLPSKKDELPSILFVLTESVRATSYCGDPAARCDVAPEVSALFPRRVAFTEMRSIGSYTAVAVSGLITGQTQNGSREDIQRMPTVFDFVHQVRANEAAPHVAYWSAQLSSLFERTDVKNAIDSFVTLETLVGTKVEDEDEVVDRGVDRLLADRAVKELEALAARSPARAPAFVVLHFAGTHAPYFGEPKDAPYQPWRREPSWSGLAALEHAYENAIHEQDKSIARAVRAFVATRGDAPWIVVLTSDHGEAFGEHGAIHHGQGLYDEQVHVPAWIAFSPGALSADEETNLRAASTRATTHLDLLPTLLDALGVLDAFALDPYRKPLRGRSLLRPLAAFEPIPITNCTAMFPCPVSTWGMLGEDRTLVAQPWDNDWRCVQHARLPVGAETAPPDDAACKALRSASRAHFPELPNHAKNPSP
jgi:glucan phosphoethanolaminetransferase (alkaline phosphatase superfamily)